MDVIYCEKNKQTRKLKCDDCDCIKHTKTSGGVTRILTDSEIKEARAARAILKRADSLKSW